MNVQELMDELRRHRPEEQVLVMIPSNAVGSNKCDECGSVAPLDWEMLLRPVGTKRLFHSNLTVFIETEDSGDRR